MVSVVWFTTRSCPGPPLLEVGVRGIDAISVRERCGETREADGARGVVRVVQDGWNCDVGVGSGGVGAAAVGVATSPTGRWTRPGPWR